MVPKGGLQLVGLPAAAVGPEQHVESGRRKREVPRYPRHNAHPSLGPFKSQIFLGFFLSTSCHRISCQRIKCDVPEPSYAADVIRVHQFLKICGIDSVIPGLCHRYRSTKGLSALSPQISQIHSMKLWPKFKA